MCSQTKKHLTQGLTWEHGEKMLYRCISTRKFLVLFVISPGTFVGVKDPEESVIWQNQSRGKINHTILNYFTNGSSVF